MRSIQVEIPSAFEPLSSQTGASLDEALKVDLSSENFELRLVDPAQSERVKVILDEESNFNQALQDVRQVLRHTNHNQADLQFNGVVVSVDRSTPGEQAEMALMKAAKATHCRFLACDMQMERDPALTRSQTFHLAYAISEITARKVHFICDDKAYLTEPGGNAKSHLYRAETDETFDGSDWY